METNLIKGVWLALIVAGVVLLIFGVRASESFSSDVSRFFTDSPTDKAVWMMIGGAVALIVGLTSLSLGVGRKA
jgi:uncharacterized membrane protein HdeD (DUF308 family)